MATGTCASLARAAWCTRRRPDSDRPRTSSSDPPARPSCPRSESPRALRISAWTSKGTSPARPDWNGDARTIVLAIFRKGAALGQEATSSWPPTGQRSAALAKGRTESSAPNPHRQGGNPDCQDNTGQARGRHQRPRPAQQRVTEVIVAASSEVAGNQFRLGEIAEIRAEPKLKKQLEGFPSARRRRSESPRSIFEGHIVVRHAHGGNQARRHHDQRSCRCHRSRRSQKIEQTKFIETAKAASQREARHRHSPHLQGARRGLRRSQVAIELSAESALKTTNGVTVVIAVRVDGKRINSEL